MVFTIQFPAATKPSGFVTRWKDKSIIAFAIFPVAVAPSGSHVARQKKLPTLLSPVDIVFFSGPGECMAMRIETIWTLDSKRVVVPSEDESLRQLLVSGIHSGRC